MTTTTDHDVERYPSIDLYVVLHLMPGASAELIDKAYRLRIREVHPDLRARGAREQATLELAQYEALLAERQEAEQLAAEAFTDEARAQAAQHAAAARQDELNQEGLDKLFSRCALGQWHVRGIALVVEGQRILAGHLLAYHRANAAASRTSPSSAMLWPARFNAPSSRQ